MSEHAERQRGKQQRRTRTDDDTNDERDELTNEFAPTHDGTGTCPSSRPPADHPPHHAAADDTCTEHDGRRFERGTGDAEQWCSSDDEHVTEHAQHADGRNEQDESECCNDGRPTHGGNRPAASHELATGVQSADVSDPVAVGIAGRPPVRTRGLGRRRPCGAGGSHREHRRHGRSARRVLVAACIVAVIVVHGMVQWSRLHDVATGPIDDVVRLVDDPRPVRGGVRVVVAHESGRYKLTVHGAMRGVVIGRRAGEHLYVVGERRALRVVRGSDIADHVAADIVARHVSPATRPAAPVYRLVARVHERIESVTARLPATDAALLRGLLVGDDRDHPEHLVRAFRAAGMGHLVAVSGQNVALVLAWAAPLIGARRRGMRVALIVAVVVVFAFVTRLEPSVVRAALMVIIARGAAAFGRDIGASRALAATVAILLVVDPLLVRSVGFVLSVAATAGLIWLTPGLTAVLGTGAIARVASATIAAQLAVAPFALWWFGSLPIIAVPANVLAVPIASAVMVVGLPLVLGCSALEAMVHAAPAPLAHLLGGFVDAFIAVALFVVHVGVRAIWWVAVLAERAGPSAGMNVVAWVLAYAACVWAVFVRRRRRGDITNPTD